MASDLIGGVEQTLRESQGRLQAILETAVDGIVTIDERGIIESANPAVASIFGYAPAELIGRNVSILMPSPHREQHDEYIARYLRTGEARVIARLLGGGPQVLATGGGAYMDPRTRANIKATGVSVWLKAELPVLLHRVRRRDNRPLLASGDHDKVMRELMETRYPIYAEADITVESREVPHDVIVADVIVALSRWLDREAKAASAKARGKSE